ncbi:MAG: hypothetical protein JWM33_1177 [Caulobacteraceae bacterium]|nr:hypothetical protein [Caulobacteraceae bacterium]
MTRRRDILIGLGLTAQIGGFWASPVVAQSLPIWAAAREPAAAPSAGDAARPPTARGAPAPAPPPAPAVTPVAAQSGPPALSMEEVLKRVREKTPGSLVGGPTRQPNGANYVVRWKTTDGRVIDVTVDAFTGAIR